MVLTRMGSKRGVKGGVALGDAPSSVSRAG
jgi:hypothetical protein